ncbi:MAG TPA: cytochrome c oxidase subunit II [Thermoanaerobaculia bacterium]|nr:cytochrome c oxidase subunit II [Thermoanaerobaculia bacterium]
MVNDFPLFPRVASSTASDVDLLYFFLVAVCGAMALLVFVLIIYFAIKYRRSPANEEAIDYHAPKWLELGVIGVWLVLFMAMFLWGAHVFFITSRPPDDAIEIYGTARQWMWKFQHMEGQREINQLHVPVGQPVKITLASEDVIHSFFVPDFRVKRDVIPNRYTTVWFTATKSGRYHLYCTEYCGTEHSKMIGWVTVMEPSEYQIWAAGGTAEGSPAAQGRKLFERYACHTCHTADTQARGPVLTDLFGSIVTLQDGRQVVADESYIRESILDPQMKVVRGFQPVMPSFRNQLNEAEALQLVAYIKSLGAGAEQPSTAPEAPGTTTAASPTAAGEQVQSEPEQNRDASIR